MKKRAANPSRRRGLGALAVLPLIVTGVPFTASAAAPKRLGVLWPGKSTGYQVTFVEAMDAKELAARGWIEGNTIEMIRRFAEDDASRVPVLAREIVDARPDVIVTAGTACTRALQQLTRTIPIFTSVGDPVGSGFAQNLARPGGNITGMSQGRREIAQKQVELLRDAVPKLSTLVFLSATKSLKYMREIAEPIVSAAQAAGISAPLRQFSSLQDLEAALRAVPPAGRGAAFLGNLGDLDEVLVMQLAIRLRVPTLVDSRGQVERGGLLSYAFRYDDESARILAIVDKLLRGADPAVIPFELPTKSDFAINRRTAATIGVTFPADFLLRADEVID